MTSSEMRGSAAARFGICAGTGRRTGIGRSQSLKKLLRRFEDDAAGTQPLTKEEHEAELSRIRTTYSPVGFPIHQPDRGRPQAADRETAPQTVAVGFA